MKQPHKHAELIKAWADGVHIQYLRVGTTDMWLDCTSIIRWDVNTEYRIKPEKEYPKSTLSYAELCKLVNYAHDKREAEGPNEEIETYLARVVADAAVKKYIQENKE